MLLRVDDCAALWKSDVPFVLVIDPLVRGVADCPVARFNGVRVEVVSSVLRRLAEWGDVIVEQSAGLCCRDYVYYLLISCF